AVYGRSGDPLPRGKRRAARIAASSGYTFAGSAIREAYRARRQTDARVEGRHLQCVEFESRHSAQSAFRFDVSPAVGDSSAAHYPTGRDLWLLKTRSTPVTRSVPCLALVPPVLAGPGS